MSHITRRTGIQIETHDVTIIRTRGLRFSVYCDRCKEDVSALAGGQGLTWLRLLQPGERTHIETDEGSLVCSNSIEG